MESHAEPARILGADYLADLMPIIAIGSGRLRAPAARAIEGAETEAGLAQLVEQRFCKAKVAGSNPAAGTISPDQDAPTETSSAPGRGAGVLSAAPVG